MARRKRRVRPERFISGDGDFEVVEFGVDDETGDSEERDAELLAEQEQAQKQADKESDDAAST